eukprot:symbB.v1.2.011654.t1/scaffold789.1/size230748/15
MHCEANCQQARAWTLCTELSNLGHAALETTTSGVYPIGHQPQVCTGVPCLFAACGYFGVPAPLPGFRSTRRSRGHFADQW